VFEYEFGLAPAWAYDADVYVWVGEGVVEQ
jgi:hypothetical protein